MDEASNTKTEARRIGLFTLAAPPILEFAWRTLPGTVAADQARAAYTRPERVVNRSPASPSGIICGVALEEKVEKRLVDHVVFKPFDLNEMVEAVNALTAGDGFVPQ